MLITFLLGILVTALAAGFLLARARRGNERLRQEIVQLTTSTAASEDSAKPAEPYRIEPGQRQWAAPQAPPESAGAHPPSLPGSHSLAGTAAEESQPGRLRAADDEPAKDHSAESRSPVEHRSVESREDGVRRGRSGEQSSAPATTTGSEQPTQPVSVDPPLSANAGAAGNGFSPLGNGSHHGGNGSSPLGNGSPHPGNGSQPSKPQQATAWPQQSGRLPQQAAGAAGQPDQDRSEHARSPYAADGAAAPVQEGDEEPMEVARRRIAELRARLGEVKPGHTSRQPEQ
ncbi:hypothetical protein DFQ14_103135 [Halopolyspora algeriensis]|uniref:Uncharacterized protein n=1 Tax=Halopolyspora algeriensis TaxID=1500506 RepID=A0A368VTM8_9ACTN|nr:hypothetical protein [Halopolyspora algeriensis]RCW45171.1 hypothetical protein DFQ14_103135 [Halopolyspora algeriensis]TQM53110.1 hypothetical protein FHU43_2488 [Halopolyspora algeriensis]